ncbi:MULTISPECIES: ABC transporter permease [unclassified Helicobacter]|uniref:ABC transporter permease n=1 Tax=unclassified Helicobacter TaxID=2593540 RepID=UPI000B2FC0C6|nr:MULTISPECIES: ABC transporter permease [unclassified Helicobacter]
MRGFRESAFEKSFGAESAFAESTFREPIFAKFRRAKIHTTFKARFSQNGNLRSFWAFVKKEFLHIFRDVRTMMILLLMPIMQILLFGFALSVDVNRINFSASASDDPTARKIIAHFSQNPYFHFHSFVQKGAESERIFDTNKVDILLNFDENFSQNLARGQAKAQFIIDASDPNYASTINLYAQNLFTQSLLQSRSIESKLLLSAQAVADSSANTSATQAQNARITPLTTMLFNPQGKSAYSFVPGLMGMILMLICAMMTSISIVREKEQGSMEILLITPLPPLFIITAKIVPYFVLSCVILGISALLLDIAMVGSMVLLLLFCALYIMLTLSIGLLVSNLAKTQLVAMLVSGMVFMMPIMMFSGMMFPIESMPAILQYFSHIVPTKWFIIGIKKIMIEGLGFCLVVKEFAILFGMFAVVLIVSLKNF